MLSVRKTDFFSPYTEKYRIITTKLKVSVVVVVVVAVVVVVVAVVVVVVPKIQC